MDRKKPIEQAIRMALKVFLFLLILPVIFILIDVISHKLPLNFKGVAESHRLTPILWVVHFIPLVIAIIAFFLFQSIYEKFNELYGRLSEQDVKISTTQKFIDRLVNGDTNVEYSLSGENDYLGKSLINLRNNIIENRKTEEQRRKEDEQRNWVAEGLAKFSDILRKDNDNMEQLSSNIIINLVRYTDSNQGGFYILNDNDENNKYFEQTTCYAYDRKKFSEKRIEWGEGLIGTCALEKQTIFMTEVPDSYLNITSGLGKANPRSILLVPLLVNEEVHGVIELASFNIYEKYQIGFIEKVAESIAATISSVKINIRTAKLLEESRDQAEALASQEEQMRQNMEELQATQEEAARQAEKFISFTNSVNHTLIRAEYDTDGTLIYANTKFLKKLGYSSNSEVEGKHISIFINEKDREWFFKIWDGLAQGGRHFEGDMKHVTKQGNDLWTMATYTCVRREDNSVEKILFLAIDTTEQKKLSLDYEGQIEAVDISNIKVEYDPEGSFLGCNDLFTVATKYSLPELKNKTAFDFISKTELDIFRENWDNVAHGIPFQGQFQIRTKDGDEKWLRGSYSPVNNMYGEVAKIVFLAHDITNEKLMEFETKQQTEKLKAQEEKLRQASVELNKKLAEAKAEMKLQFKEIEKAKVRNERTLQGALDAILTIDENSVITFFNRAAEELWGMKRSEILGKTVDMLFSKETANNDEFVKKFVEKGEEKIIGERREVKIQTRDKQEVPVLFLLSDATVDSERTFTAFIQQIEVELF